MWFDDNATQGGAGSTEGAAAPAAAPAATPAPAAAPEAPASEGSTDWESILKADSGDDAGDESFDSGLSEKSGDATPAPAAAPAPAAPKQPEATPPAATATPPAPAAEPPKTPETPPAPAADQPPQLTAEQRLTLRNNYIAEVAKEYQLTEEQSAALIASPNTVLPQLAARLRVDVVDQVVPMLAEYVRNALPGLINHITTVQTTSKANEDSFFQKWPELKAHEKEVQRIAMTWRQANPSASREQAIQEIGFLAWQAVKLPVAQLMAKLADAPATSVVEEVTRHVPAAGAAPAGFRPAPAAPAATVPAAPASKSWTEQMLDEINTED